MVPIEFPGMVLDQGIDFDYDVKSGTKPISISPYRIASTKLKKLKDQLQELLDKGFIQPSIFPWSVPVLFMNKKDGSMLICIDYHS